MLSKLIYRCLTIALLALFTQVGMSQAYVEVDAATTILDDAIEQLQTEIDNGPTITYTGSFQAFNSIDSGKRLEVQIMKLVREDIDNEKDVKVAMDNWYQKAENEVAERKIKLILTLDKVKELLS